MLNILLTFLIVSTEVPGSKGVRVLPVPGVRHPCVLPRHDVMTPHIMISCTGPHVARLISTSPGSRQRTHQVPPSASRIENWTGVAGALATAAWTKSSRPWLCPGVPVCFLSWKVARGTWVLAVMVWTKRPRLRLQTDGDVPTLIDASWEAGLWHISPWLQFILHRG